MPISPLRGPRDDRCRRSPRRRKSLWTLVRRTELGDVAGGPEGRVLPPDGAGGAGAVPGGGPARSAPDAACASCGPSSAGVAGKTASPRPSPATPPGSRNYHEVLRPGEAATVLCLAVDKAQAGIVQRYAAAYFAKVPLLRSLVTAERADGLDLKTGAELLVLASNFRGVRGRSIACAIFDECAFWRSETTSNPDVEVYAAVIPSLATIDGAMLIGISTPYRRAGLLWQKHRDHFGQDDDDVLGCAGPEPSLQPDARPEDRRRGLEARSRRRRGPNGSPNGAMTLRRSSRAS